MDSVGGAGHPGKGDRTEAVRFSPARGVAGKANGISASELGWGGEEGGRESGSRCLSCTGEPKSEGVGVVVNAVAGATTVTEGGWPVAAAAADADDRPGLAGIFGFLDVC